MRFDPFTQGIYPQLGLSPATDNRQHNRFGFTMVPTPGSGEGYLWTYPVNPYFSVTVYHLTYYEDMHYCYHHPAMLVFSLSSPIVAKMVTDRNYRHKEQLLGYYLPDGKHECTLPAGSSFDNVSITFSPEFYNHHLSQVYERDFSDLPQIAALIDGTVHIPVVSAVLKDIEAYTPTTATGELFYEGKALELIAGLIDWHTKETNNTVKSICNSDREAIHRLNHFIQQHYCEALDIHCLAKMCHMSKSKLSELYRSVYGVSIMESVNQIRTNRAKELLADSSCPIGEIASIVGYEHQSSFTFGFKQRVGMTPRDYRNLHKNTKIPSSLPEVILMPSTIQGNHDG